MRGLAAAYACMADACVHMSCWALFGAVWIALALIACLTDLLLL
jgi:hypothetical protein